MKKSLLFAAIICSVFLNAQTVFQKAYAVAFSSIPNVKDVEPTSDGGYIICAEAGLPLLNSSLFKTDANGLIQWSRVFTNDSNSSTFTFQTGECIGGGYFLFGQRYGTLSPFLGDFLTKVDASGNFLWTKQYPNDLALQGIPYIEQLPNGDFLISTSGSVLGITRVNSNGVIISSARYENDSVNPTTTEPVAAVIGSDGGMLLCSHISGIGLIKTDPVSGAIQWKKSYQDLITPKDLVPTALIKTLDNGYAIVGNGFNTTTSADDQSFIIKLDGNGNIDWWKNYTYNYGMTLTQIDQRPDGQLVVGGIDLYNHPLVLRFDSAGNLQSSGVICNNVTLQDNSYQKIYLNATADNGFVLGGTFTNYQNSSSAMALFKINSSLNFLCGYTSIILTNNLTAAPTDVPPTMYKVNRPNWMQNLGTTQATLSTFTTDYCLTFSVNEQTISGATITAFPSPIAAGENLSLQISGVTGDAIISIYDATGKLIEQFNQSISNSPIEIPTADLGKGIYLIRITNEKDELIGTTKFLVK